MEANTTGRPIRALTKTLAKLCLYGFYVAWWWPSAAAYAQASGSWLTATVEVEAASAPAATVRLRALGRREVLRQALELVEKDYNIQLSREKVLKKLLNQQHNFLSKEEWSAVKPGTLWSTRVKAWVKLDAIGQFLTKLQAQSLVATGAKAESASLEPNVGLRWDIKFVDLIHSVLWPSLQAKEGGALSPPLLFLSRLDTRLREGFGVFEKPPHFYIADNTENNTAPVSASMPSLRGQFVFRLRAKNHRDPQPELRVNIKLVHKKEQVLARFEKAYFLPRTALEQSQVLQMQQLFTQSLTLLTQIKADLQQLWHKGVLGSNVMVLKLDTPALSLGERETLAKSLERHTPLKNLKPRLLSHKQAVYESHTVVDAQHVAERIRKLNFPPYQIGIKKVLRGMLHLRASIKKTRHK